MAIEMEFSGVGGGWTNVTADVREAGHPIQIGYGIRGSGPNDRVASTGTMTFALENSTANSGGLLGYYSPNNANVRAGFALGIRVRISFTYAGTTYYKFIGSIDSVTPVPGQKRERVSLITVVDWMDEAARFQLKGLPTVVSTDANAVLDQILAAMPIQPNATDLDDGSDTYAYAMANGSAEQVAALAEFQRLMVSEQGRLVMRGGTSEATAGTLRFFNRSAFVTDPMNVSQGTFNDDMCAMGADYSRRAVLNVFRMSVHPRTVDPPTNTAQVLFTFQSRPSIDPGKTLVVLGQYTDPAQTATRISGYNMVTPVSGTDYKFNSNPEGTGADLSADFTLTTNYGSEGVKYTITNNGAVAGYVALLQARGYGIYDYEPVQIETRNAASVTTNGESPIPVDLWYQSDPTFAKNVGDYMLPYWQDPTTNVESVTFKANVSPALLAQTLAREPGDRITLQETVTGVNRAFVIQAVDLSIYSRNLIDCTWTLTPQADTTDYWILEEMGTALDTNTTIAL